MVFISSIVSLIRDAIIPKQIIPVNTRMTTNNGFILLLQCKKNKGYSKSFLACNARATNEYMDRVSVAYLCNRYFNPILKGFFLDQHIRVDENGWALSELLQFIFRSAIRNEEEINMYIPSSRMRFLLEEWIEKGDKASYPPPGNR